MGSRTVAVIDPGPDVERHVRALAIAVQEANAVTIVLTHGHGDHADAAPALAAEIGAEVWGPDGIDAVDRRLGDGDAVVTDEGELVAVHTPGHAADHLCLHWRERSALFAGDLMLGRGDTTWVAEYPGCVADYLTSLDRLRGLDLRVIYPAHGPPLEDPAAAIARFEGHRRERIRQVEDALSKRPGVEVEELMEIVYGNTVPDGLRGAAVRSLVALREYVEGSDG